MNIQKNIKYNLTYAMKKENMSLTEFAKKLGIARSSLQQYLSGASNPRADTIQLLADKLNIPVEALVGNPDFSPPVLSEKVTGDFADICFILKDISKDYYKLHLDCMALSQALLEKLGYGEGFEED